jgi:hypothetical protein
MQIFLAPPYHKLKLLYGGWAYLCWVIIGVFYLNKAGQLISWHALYFLTIKGLIISLLISGFLYLLIRFNIALLSKKTNLYIPFRKLRTSSLPLQILSHIAFQTYILFLIATTQLSNSP